MIGVSFMGDLFHDDVPDAFIRSVWAIMATAAQHTYLVLTKRPERMQAVLAHQAKHLKREYPNVHLGFSASTQADFDAGIEYLIQTPAPVRFVSLEPLLESIDVSRVVGNRECANCGRSFVESDYTEQPAGEPCPNCYTEDTGNIYGVQSYVDWVIVGGESGPGARPMHPDWVRSIRDDCVAAEVPFYFKQWGESLPGDPT